MNGVSGQGRGAHCRLCKVSGNPGIAGARVNVRYLGPFGEHILDKSFTASPYRPDSGRSAVPGGTSLHAPHLPFNGNEGRLFRIGWKTETD
jgi:hypothetical protein